MHRVASTLLAGSARHARRSPVVFRALAAARSVHNRVSPPYNVENGMGDFLPPASLKMIAEDYQQGLLDRLNEEIRDTAQSAKSVVQTVIEAAQDPSKVLMFNYASEALNNSFFLQCLKPPQEGASDHEDDISPYFATRIRDSFGELGQLKSTFSATAMGMFGSGWVWLVADQSGELAVLPTFGAGTLLVRSQEPIQAKVNRGSTAIIGEEQLSTSRRRAIPGVNPGGQPAASSPTSGVSSQQHPPHPPTQTRQFSMSALRANDFKPASLSDRKREPTGNMIFPLLCLSVHEHAWISAGYGVWGKEEYLKRFWSVVNWGQVSRHYEAYCPNTLTAV